MSEITYQFLPLDDEESGSINLADDPKLALLAVSIASQQSAGFKEYLDLREVHCPDCGAAGFNTGWGYWHFVCGAEILSDGEPSEPCGDPTRPDQRARGTDNGN